jgi:branched-chain amino acid aminotransferase
VYTITRTYQRDKALLLEAHLDRLEESARLEGIALTLDREALRAALRQMIAQSGYSELRFRITVPRQQPDHLYLTLEPLAAPAPTLRTNGVKVATIPLHRENPLAKNNTWMQQRQAAMAHLASDIYEALLLDEAGHLLEGSSSNFYAVLRGELRTAEAGILKGISRKALLEVAAPLLPIRLEPIHRNELGDLAQAFLTSSSRGVIPIIQVDEVIIGEGLPHPQTLQLAVAYDAWTEAHLEAI